MCARIVHIASEIAPIAKVGGLADVVAGLSQAVASEGHDVTIVIPKYSLIDLSQLAQYKLDRVDTFQIRYDQREERGFVEYFSFQNSTLCLLDTEYNSWQSRPKIYGSIEEDTRLFIHFSLAAATWLACSESFLSSPPDVVHLHDWQTASIGALLHPEGKIALPYNQPKIVLTLHNLEYQGRCHYSELSLAGYDFQNRFLYNAALDPSHHGANLLKLGIVAADIVTTVSPNYAKEIITGLSDRGLREALLSKKENFIGILNGIDETYWNPSQDPFLPAPYNVSMPIEEIRYAKKRAQQKIGELLDIPFYDQDRKRPLIGVVTRLVEQKGLYLLESVLEQAEELDIECIFLGTAYEQKIYDRFEELNQQLRRQKRGAVLLKNSEEMAHLIFAASDLFLVPSLFEPCGLTQIIAMRYGSIPVVRMTGGLVDTVVDIDYPVISKYVMGSNGFVFCHPDRTGIRSALDRAIHYFTSDPEKWGSVYIKNALAQNFSWKSSAIEYLRIYGIEKPVLIE